MRLLLLRRHLRLPTLQCLYPAHRFDLALLLLRRRYLQQNYHHQSHLCFLLPLIRDHRHRHRLMTMNQKQNLTRSYR